ncbi:MAG: diacylglycerol kinase family protein [Verrucomicrobiota bacterium]
MHRLTNSFRHAFRGLATAFRTQPNFRLHILATTFALAFGLLLRIYPGEWAALIIVIALVLGAECFNTALEFLADRVTTDHDPLIGKAKDLSAAAVLIFSIAAATTVALIFLPKVYAWLPNGSQLKN